MKEQMNDTDIALVEFVNGNIDLAAKILAVVNERYPVQVRYVLDNLALMYDYLDDVIRSHKPPEVVK